jgi:1,4-dihydroxy-2-naphthoate octaprenyltransferase
MCYVLGAGVADYFGLDFRVAAFWMGLLWTLLLQWGAALLVGSFRRPAERRPELGPPPEGMPIKSLALAVAAVALTGASALTVLMRLSQIHSLPVYLVQFAAVVLALSLSVPPLQLVHSGFGELILSALIGVVPATLAFLLQADTYHRLLSAVMFPVVLLCFAWLLALDFPSFATDQKYGRQSLLQRAGWELAVPLHHAAIMAAYGLLLSGPFLGISLSVLWPGYLGIPFAVLQILLLQSLARGARPNWPLLRATSTSVVGLTVYFLTLSFWLH